MAEEKIEINILVVDDIEANLIAMEHLLADMQVNVITATSGYDALALTLKKEFALVLLDVQMPELDGYQTAQMMQTSENSKHIPIIFVSAKSLDDTDMLKGYQSGAVDYVRKPVQAPVLRSKVSVFVKLYNQRAQLLSLNAEIGSMLSNLEIMVEDRTIELRQTIKSLETLMTEHKTMQGQMVEQEMMAELGRLVAGVAHEVNTPIGVGVTAASHLKGKTQEILTLSESGSMKRSDLSSYFDIANQSSELILLNLKRAADLVRSFKRIAVDQSSHEYRNFSLKESVDDVVASLHSELKKRNHIVKISCLDTLMLNSLPGLYAQIFTNLIMNSIIHGFEFKDKGEINISAELNNTCIEIIYKDNGKGMASEDLENIFKPFFTTKRDHGGSGIGASVIFNSIKELGGKIEVKSTVGEGITFLIEMPLDANSLKEKSHV